MTTNTLDDLIARLAELPPAERAEIERMAAEATADRIWLPNPGPQSDAFYCPADELLFGGEAGGGKSDLIIGLSLTEHQRSLVLRRTNKEAEKLYDRYEEIIGNTIGKNSQSGWRIGGRIIDIGGCQLEQDKQKRKGIAHDLKAFDELVDFTRTQYEFIITWTRSTDPKQRTRVVATTNPPTKAEGMWVVERWAPWLDPAYPHPAQSGEIRWFLQEGDREVEVDGPGPHMIKGKPYYAKSRCFIRSKLSDNPDLTRNEDYQRTLDGLPEELRDAYREGKFDARLEDQPMQCIPTEWVRAAQERWVAHPYPHDGVPMCAMGVDASGGGKDPMVVAPRYDGWYAKLIKVPGKELPPDRLGAHSAGIIVSHRTSNAKVIVDMGGGYGGSIYETLKANGVDVDGYKGAAESVQRTVEGQLKFTNMRTQTYWRFREALDPAQPGGSPIMLPPDPRLLAQLVCPTYEITPNGIKLEPKVTRDTHGQVNGGVMYKLGHSPDEADAVVMAWSGGPTFYTHGRNWEQAAANKRPLGRRPQVVMGRQNRH